MTNRLANKECLICGEKLVRVDGVTFCSRHEAEVNRKVSSMLAKRERVKRGVERPDPKFGHRIKKGNAL